MKKFLALLLCLFSIFVFAACELPEDSATEPSSSVLNSSTPDSSVPDSSVPGTSLPNTTPSTPATASPTVPTPTSPTVPPTESPTTPPTEPSTQPEPDFREIFMAAHSVGQKFSFTLGVDSYEISLNSKTGICTVLHQQKVQDEIDFNLGPISYPSDRPLTYLRSYYYMGTYKPSAGGTMKVHFDNYYLAVDLTGFSKSTITAIREHVWKNIGNGEWQDYYLTQAECQMWDTLLDGKAAKDIRRWIETMELSGSASLPLQMTYYDSDGGKTRSISLSDAQIKWTDYYYAGAYRDRVYDLDGNSLYWYEQHSDGSYSRTEYDAQGHICYSIHTSADGSYSEQIAVWNGDILTATTCYYAIDKVDGLYCTERYVSVTRYDPDNPSIGIPISDHRYERDNKLVYFTIYTEKGLPLETLRTDGPFGEVHTYYTYENDRLVKIVATDAENNVTTKEYIYENGRLITLRCTRQYANGDIEQWEESPPAAPDTPPQ